MKSIFQITRFLFSILLLFATNTLRAGDPPPNDNFADRFPVTGSSITVTSCNYFASKEASEPTIKFTNNMSNAGGKSVWWGWTPSVSGVARVTSFGSGNGSMDTILGVYTGSSLSGLTWVTGNDDAPSGTQSMVTFGVTAGTQYQIAVDGFNGASNTIVVNMHVTNTVPSLFLASPTNNSTFSVPATIPLTVYSSDFVPTTPWPNGVTNVSFYTNGVLVKRCGTNTTNPIMWTNSVALGVGNYNFTVVSYARTGKTNSTTSTVTVIPNVAPTVSLTNPVDGTLLYTPLSLTLMASAFDPYGGSVTNVEFYNGSTKLGQDTTAPYTNLWNNVPAGAYTLSARAYDNMGLVATSSPVTITVNPNIPPVVSITNPINGASFGAPVNITIGASATDNPGGSVTNLEFYAGNTKLGQDTTPPYLFTWTNPAAGPYSLKVVAYDNAGLVSTSAPVSITVVPNTPPTVSLTSPSNDQGYVGPANVALAANASDSDGVVTNVEFYANGVEIGQDASSPYSFVWNGVLAGNYVLTAVAYDSAGTSATSSPVSIIVSNTAPPVVRITSPATNATFTAGLDLAILATASDTDGTVSKVEFFQGTSKLGESTTAPFGYTWGNVSSGAYALSAIATDNSGTKGTSVVINISVSAVSSWQTNLVPGESIWKYLDNGSDQGTVWRGLTFNDNSWASGKAQLGYGDGDEVTTVGYGTDANNKYITTYFRRSFMLTNVYRYSNLVLRLLRDDGAVVYINSNEVFRSNMPDGAPNSLTPAVLGIAGLEECIAWNSTNIVSPSSILRNGTNVIAVEIHQNAGTSTDISFDLEMIGEMLPGTNQPPMVAFDYPTSGSTFYVPGVITNQVTASDVDGTVTNVDFYANGVRIGRDRTSPWTLNWTNPAGGSYTLVAVAFDNNGATNTSSPISITVISGSPPTVTLTSPTNGTMYAGQTNILLTATASDSDGSIARVEFFRGATSLGVDATAPYSALWVNAPVGSYALYAVATDNNGLVTTSAPVNITIGGMISTWVAYNDHVAGNVGTDTAVNATTNQMRQTGGPYTLKNIVDGSTLANVTMTVAVSGGTPANGGSGGVPTADSPLYNAFNGYCYLGANTIQIASSETVTVTISGLDPNRRYKFQAGACRGGGVPRSLGTVQYPGSGLRDPESPAKCHQPVRHYHGSERVHASDRLPGCGQHR